jgi:hypothetical protein
VAVEEMQLARQSEHIVQYVANMIDEADKWNRYAAVKVKEGDFEEAGKAIEQSNLYLAEVAKHQALEAQVVAGLTETLVAAIAQRDKVIGDYEAVQDSFNLQSRVAVNEAVEYVLTDGGMAGDAEIGFLAEQIEAKGIEAVRAERHQELEQRLELAEEQVAERAKDNTPGHHGVGASFTFRANPEFDPTEALAYDEPETMTSKTTMSQAMTTTILISRTMMMTPKTLSRLNIIRVPNPTTLKTTKQSKL